MKQINKRRYIRLTSKSYGNSSESSILFLCALFAYMYETYNKDCDIKIFLTICPNESSKNKN